MTKTLKPLGEVQQVETPEGDGGFVNTTIDPLMRGINTLQAGVMQAMGDSIGAAQQNRDRASYPDSGRMEEFYATDTGGILESIGYLLTNPATGAEVALEGVGTSAPMMAGMLAQAAITKNPAMLANAVGVGGQSTLIEYGNIALEELSKNGYNLSLIHI